MVCQGNRIKRWLVASSILNNIEPEMVGICQQLGCIDEEIINMSNKHNPSSPCNSEILEDFRKYLALSYLWVLGAYELIRTLSQRCKKDKSIFTNNTISKINKLKQDLERVRIPLAKMEAAQRYKKTDYTFAYPINTKKGIGWRVSDECFILRINLSNQFLDLLENIEIKP